MQSSTRTPSRTVSRLRSTPSLTTGELTAAQISVRDDANEHVVRDDRHMPISCPVHLDQYIVKMGVRRHYFERMTHEILNAQYCHVHPRRHSL